MVVLYKNSNENNELYYAELLTSPENLETAVYIDVGENKSLKRPHTPDRKQSHINSVIIEDVVCIYKNEEILKLHRANMFI